MSSSRSRPRRSTRSSTRFSRRWRKPGADVTVPTHAPHAEAVSESSDFASDRILARIGALTKTLRDSMRELGLDKHVELAAEAVPDARDRLKYVANMTEQAAERVLTAIDIAKPLQEQLQADAAALDGRWERW